jgi:hypothetical protein
VTFDFADEPELQSHHFGFHISDAEFDAIFGRVKERKLSYGSAPYNHTVKSISAAAGAAFTSSISTVTCLQ